MIKMITRIMQTCLSVKRGMIQLLAYSSLQHVSRSGGTLEIASFSAGEVMDSHAQPELYGVTARPVEVSLGPSRCVLNSSA